MPHSLESVLVIDVEATCWRGPVPEGQQSEIIEIGVCRLAVDGSRLQREDILVKPERSSVSEFCTELTTLTQEDVDRGISFEAACQLLREKFRSHEHVWASYGEYDRTIFQKQCADSGTVYPFNARHINVKTLFALVMRMPYEVGMAHALSALNIPLEGVHHRGGDDAWNIAAILSRLLFEGRQETVHELASSDPDA